MMTEITTAWISHIRWMNGWDALESAAALGTPRVWLVNTPDAHKRFSDDRYQGILNEHELQRAARFHQATHAARFETARILLRLLMARSTTADPKAIGFTDGYHHKPFLSMPEDTNIEFNVSYTENRAMIGLASGYPVGIDIEWLHRPLDIQDMLEACFSDNEIAFITSHKESMIYRFFTLWTRKEAILKLTGEGIGEHLPRFEVLDGACMADRSITGEHSPDRIYLYSFPVTDQYIGSFATPKPVADVAFYVL
ncbi:4'-phosphopantetheinyl transferase family protein [Parapedobacter sp. DT-150]|uniref:4'-phosphopantetheinyl transferase family protein n=1 Tax=Parapedobacter sp. DT-150 TaxID=3396162 RepID=UPI003F1BC419